MAQRWVFIAISSVIGLTFLATQARWETKSDPVFVAAPNAPASAQGAAAFALDNFGGLSLNAMESHAIPWKLSAAALALEEQRKNGNSDVSLRDVDRALSRFGFLVGSTPVNLPNGVIAGTQAKTPLGITHGTLNPLPGAPVAVANLGCAACHSGVVYQADGRPHPQKAWLGAPNTSLNLEAYVSRLTEASRFAAKDPALWVSTAQTLFPEMGWRERWTLRWLVVPLANRRLSAIGEGAALPFPNGHPGATNGVAALKTRFELPLMDGGAGDAGFVSIPELGGRLWRSSLLADGSYAPQGQPRWMPILTRVDVTARRDALAGITTFFSVPSMGVDPEDALDYVPGVESVFAWLDEMYQPQPFPAEIDLKKAQKGAALYARHCASCHGTYADRSNGPELISFPNWAGDVGTDPLRAQAFTPELAEKVNASAFGDRILAEATGVYAAQPLTGLWSSAPYLHNGSIPSILTLLTPDARPERFDIGGHTLDFETLGIKPRVPTEGEPTFGNPLEIDTTRPGMGNAGHDYGGTLSPTEKQALIEFLKQI